MPTAWPTNSSTIARSRSIRRWSTAGSTAPGGEKVFNRNSTTFKELPDEAKAGIDRKRAREMILAETNLIKRPVLDAGDTLLLGFKADTYAKALAK
jgi:arsenate reductase-like glutaredoxin family protein